MRKKIRIQGDSSPILPPELIKDYLLLNDESKKLFNRAFRVLWWHLSGHEDIKRQHNISINYWIIESFRLSLSPPLSSSHLSILTFLYYASSNGANILHSDTLYYSDCIKHLTQGSKAVYLTDLVKDGYISRSHRDSSRPYMACSVSKNPVFLTMTDKTINLMRGIEKEINNIILRTSLNELKAIRKQQKTPAKLNEG